MEYESNPMIDYELAKKIKDDIESAKNRGVKTTTLHDEVIKVSASLRTGENALMKLGIPDLDHAIGGGVQAGEMVVIGARPGHGKSAIALQMAHYMTQQGIPILIVSQEMSGIALGKRTIQFISEIPQDDWAFKVDDLNDEIEQHFSERAEAYILETIPNAISMCEQAVKMQKTHGVRVLFVDYAQIVQGIGKSQYERVTDVSSRMRRLATESGLVIISLAQLSREVEKRPEFHPTGKDLKDSGQLEQDADIVLFAVWPYKLDQKKDRNHYQFLVEKNRNRGIVSHGFDVYFEPERQRYLDKNVNAIQDSGFDDFNTFR